MGFVRPNKRQRPDAPRVDEDEEIEQLNGRLQEHSPAPGTQPFTEDGAKRTLFTSLPLSHRTLNGLAGAGFEVMTEIQVAAVPHALAGRDVLGAAKTGSGKTLAFLLPLLEKLYRSRWTFSDGLGALIVSPTRELALQIFEVLRTIGKHHQLSAGLVTGGKKEFREEQGRVGRINILVATPGRLLQHLEQTPGFDASHLEVLVLDEADRILDLGFREQLNSILTYLPPERQTMLFSATQTKSVKDLARLSLKKGSVEYVSVHDKDAMATPDKLVQNYIICPLGEKLNVLFSFMRTHTKSKMIVFFNSCSQVRFVYELFCTLQPGAPLLALHGKCKQMKRTQIYFDFLKKPAAVLFATDIAARGLDFPRVDWVIQGDAPEDVESYIHRVGRTARYKSSGRALMLLLPSEEEGMEQLMSQKKIPLKRLTVNPDKMKMAGSVTKKAATAVAADPEKKRLAEKAFTSYVRSIQLMPNKQIFRPAEMPLDEFAVSLGLAYTPRVPSMAAATTEGGEAGEDGAREAVRKKKNENRSLQRLKEQIKLEKARRKAERDGKPMPEAPVPGAGRKRPRSEEAHGDEDDLLVVKRKIPPAEGEKDAGHVVESDEEDEAVPEPSAKKRKKKEEKMRITRDGLGLKAVVAGGKKIIFDEDGQETEVVPPLQAFARDVAAGGGSGLAVAGLKEANEEYIERVRARLKATEAEDKARERERVRDKHQKKRNKERGPADEPEGGAAVLAGAESSDEEGSGIGGESDSDEDEFELPGGPANTSDDEPEGDGGRSVEGSLSEADSDSESSVSWKEAEGRRGKHRSAQPEDVRASEEAVLRMLAKRK